MLARRKSMSDLARSPSQIGNLIRRQRKKLGLSQAQLGEKVGLRQATVSLIETGNPAARIDTLLALLASLDLEFRIALRSRQSLREQDIEDLIG
jgi:HTH-type transcriptional regulator/antitoxin HipB